VWLVSSGERLQRIGTAAAVLSGGAAIYFGALALTGFKLRSLLQR
jgi:hypothetical protein